MDGGLLLTLVLLDFVSYWEQ